MMCARRRLTGDRTIARLFGFAVEDVCGGRIPFDTYLRAIHPQERIGIRQKLTTAMLSDAGYEGDYRIIQPDGTIIWVLARGTSERDETGQVVRFAGLIFDITARKRDEEALRLSEERFRLMADTTPMMIWMTDASGHCTYLSSLWYTFTGQTPASGLGFGWLDAIHPDDRAQTQADVLLSTVHQQTLQLEYRLRHADGSYHWVIDTAAPRIGDDQTFLGYIGSVIDVTARKRANARERFLYQYLDSLRALVTPDQIISTAARLVGEYLAVDRCVYVEVEADATHFNTIGMYVTPGTKITTGRAKFVDFGAEARRTLYNDLPYVIEDAATDPHTAAYRSVYRAIQVGAAIAIPQTKYGRLVGVMAVHQQQPRRWTSDDIELVRLSATICWEAFERARATLNLRENEERLQTLYQQEQTARQQAETANRLKDDFLATVSHELRTPLTTILGYGHLLQSHSYNRLDTERFMNVIVQSAELQTKLIDDLLDVSRIVTGKMRLSTRIIDLADVIRQAIEAVRPALEAKALRLHVALAPGQSLISGDPQRLQQVMWNLLANATKFTPENGTITLQLEHVGRQAQITLSDTGRGISAEFLPFIFDRFRQADSASNRTHSGLGLGLAIVRHLVEMHGGTVHAHSAGLDLGAQFTVCLPLIEQLGADSVATARQAAWVCPPEISGLRVLIVDNQIDILEMLDRLFTQCGAIVKIHASAGPALATLQRWQPDILVSDIAMPGQDGYWLIQQVRALEAAQGGATLAVALTAYVGVDDRARVLEAGFQQYMSKPLNPTELMTMVADLVSEQPV